MNYHDLILVRHPDGHVGLEDAYVFLSGEMLTQTIRRQILPLAAELNRGVFERAGGGDRVFLKNWPVVEDMRKAFEAGNLPGVVTLYKRLPPELRESKPIMIMYLVAAQTDDAEYVRGLDGFRRLFPGDPAIDFLSIDYFTVKKDYDRVLRCIASVQAATGGDPYLDVLRAEALVAAGRLKEARSAAEKAIRDEPDLADGYWSRITMALREKNHKDTLAWLKKLVEKTGTEVKDLADLDEYKDFVRSPEYAAWEKWYAARRKE
jgi:tetratricopeptide (TPR) repeat protein